jgi:hypothetical protein
VAMFQFQFRTSGYDFIELICMESCWMSVLETFFQNLIDRFPFSVVLFTNDSADIICYHHLQKNKYMKSEHFSFIFPCCEGSG